MSLLIACVISLVSIAPPDPAPLRKSWRDASRCGHNSLCTMFWLWKHFRGSMDDVEALLPDRPQGVSLEELRLAANQLGFPASALYLEWGEWRAAPHRVPMPCIVHLNTRSGHYVVALRINETHIAICDPTACTVQYLTHDAFGSRYTGYALVYTPWTRVLAPWLFGGTALGIAARWLAGARKRFRGGAR